MTKKDFKNLIIIFIAIILLVGFLGCGKLTTNIQPTTNQEPVNAQAPITDTKSPATTTLATTTEELDTSGWQTYRSEEWGFELKYPNDWIIDNNDLTNVVLNSPKNEEIRNNIKSGKPYYGYMNDVTISYYMSIKDEPLNKHSLNATTLDDFMRRSNFLSNVEKTEFANQEAWTAEVGGAGIEYIIFTKNSEGNLYKINFGHKKKSWLTEIDNKIISSFQFIK